MKRILLSALLLIVSATAGAEECHETSWNVPGVRPVTDLDREIQLRELRTGIKNLGIDPNLPIPENCALPVEIALEYWASEGTLDWQVMRDRMSPADNEMIQYLIMDLSVVVTSGNWPGHIKSWVLNRLILRDRCISYPKIKAEQDAIQDRLDHRSKSPH